MSKLNNLDFTALNLSGDNYFQWALDAKIILKSKGLGECIVDGNEEPDKNKYKAILIIRHHLVESLKDQYVTIENPLDLWNELKNRYDHQRTVLLAKAMYDWRNLSIQDFKSVHEYNSAMFKIVSILKLCGEEISEKDMLEKTFSTFHTSNQNNELLMGNSEMRPPGTAPLPEANDVASDKKEAKEAHHVQRDNKTSGRGRGKWQGRDRSHFSGHGQGRGRGYHGGKGRSRGTSSKPQNPTGKTICHRCGMGNHWAKNCRTPKYFVDLYQESIKGKNP
ncbi:uncharacterized protein LOC111829059 [Capsella rubella]|uniref:uncharacterized protein LOC111829059 n=1 Tax=Capsella rubella TaxID=81985 RepID=UPI000CD58113|nr:uncharacterized protein LOC111829059 [Capsella rubella]